MRRVQVERVYFENGIKITRYEPREARGARDIRAWAANRLQNGWALAGAHPEACEPLDPNGEQVSYADFAAKCVNCGDYATKAIGLTRDGKAVVPSCDNCEFVVLRKGMPKYCLTA